MNVSRQYELKRSDVRNLCQSICCNSLPMALVSSLIQNEVCVREATCEKLAAGPLAGDVEVGIFSAAH